MLRIKCQMYRIDWDKLINNKNIFPCTKTYDVLKKKDLQKK